jgi:outer membrane usher protein
VAGAAVAFAVSASARADTATVTSTTTSTAASTTTATADIAADLASTAAVRDPPGPETLELDVVINGQQIGKIGEFVQIGAVLLARRHELTELGFRLPANVVPVTDDLIALTSLPGVSARFDAATQTIYFTAASEALLPNLLRPAANPASAIPLQSAVGATLNYDVVGAVSNGHAYGSGLFDARIFSPIGVASTDFLAYGGANPNGLGQDPVTRLDSTYVYSDFNAQRRYWLGDVISGGLTWTRPVRLGGAQVTRDFTMRPDLVTFPLPIVSGTAAVPSTVDVLVNGTRVLSSQAQPGPFQVPQLPIVTGAGTVQVTVTNALGQQVTTTLPFYASASLLAPGLHTYSLEAGWVRLNWGLVSNDYRAFAASGTYRRGLTDNVTIEMHAEETRDQFMGGGGVVVNAFDFAVVNLGGAASTAEGHTGGELAVGVQRISPTFSFGASAVLATPGFRDIAAMNGDPVPTREISANASAYLGKWGTVGLAWLQVDRPAATSLVSLTGPPAFNPPGMQPSPSGIGLGNGSLPFVPAQTSQVLTASYSVQLFHKVFFFANVFHDFAIGGGDGASVGFTIPLGRRSSVSASGNYQNGSPAYGQVQVQQNAVNIGDWGYQAFVSGPSNDHEFGQLQYKSPWSLFTVGVDHLDRETTLRVEAQGAFTVADDRLFASNTIDQSFAVVDTGGVGGVHVLYENRPDGITDSSGRLLVPDLRSWDVNRLSIDPADVPIDAQVPYTERQVRPPDRSGVVVKFPIRKINGALLVLVDDTGHPIPVGSTATLQATGVVAPVGYDGETFIENLGKTNQLVIQLPNDARCVVAFGFTPTPGAIPKVGPLTCRNDDR